MSSSPISTEEELDLGEAIRVLLANWRDELVAVAREIIASRQRPELVFHVHPDVIIIRRHTNEGQSTLGEIWLSSLPPGGFGKALIRMAGTGLRHVLLSIPQDQVLRPQLTMPRARRGALAQALRYELERLSPLDPSEVYFDFIARQDENNPALAAIELRIVRKKLLDEAIALCRMAELSVSAIGFETDGREADWRAFPVDWKALLRRLSGRYGFIALSGLAFALILVILAGIFVRNELTLNALSDAVADAGIRAARVERVEQESRLVASDLSYAVRQKRNPMFVSTLAELSRILPDNTFVTELAAEGGKVRIQGTSASASDLIALIDRSSAFTNAQFDAAVVRDPASGNDHFDLSFDLRKGRP